MIGTLGEGGLYPVLMLRSAANRELVGQINRFRIYEGVSKIFRTGHLARELQMVHLSTTRCSCIAIL
jgi:hypothetical protein